MRRYGLKYHVVGGFSFYERAEIKDMISYLKVIHNPDDSISLLRVINTPARGIGKGTIDTLERLALETGLSLWGAIGEAIKRQLLPARALASLKSFQELIEDARAMLARTFAEQLAESTASVGVNDSRVQQSAPPESMWGQPPSAVQQGEACSLTAKTALNPKTLPHSIPPSSGISRLISARRIPSGFGCGGGTPPRQPAGRRRYEW